MRGHQIRTSASCRDCGRHLALFRDPAACENCAGTQRELIPWTELFRLRGRALELEPQ